MKKNILWLFFIPLLVLMSFPRLGFALPIQPMLYAASLVSPNTSTPTLNVYGYYKHTIQVTTSGVSTNVVVQLQGNNDDKNWFNLDDNGTNTTITSNTTLMFHKDNFAMKNFRFKWISVGGSEPSPNIDIIYMGGL